MKGGKRIKEQFKDLPYSFGAASLAVILGIGQGIIKTGEGILMSNRIGAGGAFNFGIGNSRDFISDYVEIKELLKKEKLLKEEKKFKREKKKALVKEVKKEEKKEVKKEVKKAKPKKGKKK